MNKKGSGAGGAMIVVWLMVCLVGAGIFPPELGPKIYILWGIFTIGFPLLLSFVVWLDPFGLKQITDRWQGLN